LTGSVADVWVTQLSRRPETEVPVEVWILVSVILGLLVFDILALRHGADSRPEWENPRNWS